MFERERAPRLTSSFILSASKPNRAVSTVAASSLEMPMRWPVS